MQKYICSYNNEDTPDFESEVFECWADDSEHAREQCQNAYPTAFIAEVYLADNKVSERFYLVTDPCYVVDNNEWHSFLEKTDFGQCLGENYEVKGFGKIIECGRTSYGDGEWNVAPNKTVAADAGLVCIVQLNYAVDLKAFFKSRGYHEEFIPNAVTNDIMEAKGWLEYVQNGELYEDELF